MKWVKVVSGFCGSISGLLMGFFCVTGAFLLVCLVLWATMAVIQKIDGLFGNMI